MDDLKYTEDYVEQLEGELEAIRISHQQLTGELHGVYGSKPYRLGKLASVAYRDPIKVVKKVARIAKNTKRFSPQALKYMRAATPHNSAVFDVAYKKWQKEFEPSESELDQQRKNAKLLKKQPLFSIITPVFQPPKQVLIDLIESVLAQTYTNFELCLGEFAGDETSQKVLAEYAAKDTRIKVKHFDENDGISTNSNLCLTLASGDYVGLLDHDDLLSPDALYENALMINKKDYDFIYSDKDKVDEAGNRFDPMFKPDWSPELMMTANYLTHFNIFKRSLLDKIGGWDKSTDGAQDWDLFFRLISAGKHVGHIPKILYHWRVLITSTAHSISTKPYALAGQRRAIEKYVDSLGIDQPNVKHSKEGALSLEWGSVAVSRKKIHCIVFTQQDTINKAQKLSKKLIKTRRLTKEDISVYVSGDTENKFGKLVAETQKTADVLLFIDARVTALDRTSLIDELVGWLSIPGVGIASPHIYSKFGVFLEAGRVIGLGSSLSLLFAGENYIPGIFGYREWSRNVSIPSMHCFAVNSEAIGDTIIGQEGIQGLRELVVATTANGYRTMVTPFDSVVVDTTALYEPALSKKNQKLLSVTVPNLEDPYFSTNLSATKKYPTFMSAAESLSRKSTIESYMDKPIEYDPSASTLNADYREQQELPLVGYKRDAYILSGITDYEAKDIVRSRKITNSTDCIESIESALWILPYFTTMYAGLKNIFALASQMTTNENTKHTFYIATQENTTDIRELVLATFPNLKSSEFLNAEAYNKIKDTREFTIGVCSLWTTAYDLLHNNNLKRKLYIIQDDERTFYPRGSLYGLVDATYDFGFWGIAGTEALADWYKKKQQSRGVATVVGSELDLVSYLNVSKTPKAKTSKEHPRVLFYARPDAPRNGFELGLHGLNKLAEKLDGRVDIVLAGADFDIARYEGIHSSIRAAGKVAYKDLAEFYASFDAALFLMFSEHPGVFPLEMMASSVPLVINKHQNNSWNELYKDGETCVLSDCSASTIATSLHRVLTDKVLSNKLIHTGRLLAEERNSLSYNQQASNAIEMIKNGR